MGGQGVLDRGSRVGVCPPVSLPHVGTEPLCASGVLAGGWTGTEGAPRVGRVEPKICKGCVGAACTSQGCNKVRNDGFVYIPAGSSFPLPSEVSTEQRRMNVLGFPDMALFCSSSTSAPPTSPLASAAHIRTCSRVSGRRKASRPPPTRAEEARRMGTTLVIPTKEEKMEFPRMAPNLQSPLRMPKAVPLSGGKAESNG